MISIKYADFGLDVGDQQIQGILVGFMILFDFP